MGVAPAGEKGPGLAHKGWPTQMKGSLARAGRGIAGCAGEVERAGVGLVPVRWSWARLGGEASAGEGAWHSHR